MIWFLIKDEPPRDLRRLNTWQSGLRRLDGTKKPSYAAWLRLTGVAKRAPVR